MTQNYASKVINVIQIVILTNNRLIFLQTSFRVNHPSECVHKALAKNSVMNYEHYVHD